MARRGVAIPAEEPAVPVFGRLSGRKGFGVYEATGLLAQEAAISVPAVINE